jgi:hypothetical protein
MDEVPLNSGDTIENAESANLKDAREQAVSDFEHSKQLFEGAYYKGEVLPTLGLSYFLNQMGELEPQEENLKKALEEKAKWEDVENQSAFKPEEDLKEGLEDGKDLSDFMKMVRNIYNEPELGSDTAKYLRHMAGKLILENKNTNFAKSLSSTADALDSNIKRNNHGA